MKSEQRLEVLKRIEELQHDTTTVSVQIGHVDDKSGIVKSNSIYITDAPAKIINELRDEGYSISVDERGARIKDFR